MKKQIKGFVIGVIVTLLLSSTIVLGEGVKKTIEVVFNSVNLTVNGEKVAADTILYNGTTYVPLRATAEMLGKEVGWDQKTSTASINDKGTVVNTPVSNSKNEYTVKDSNGKALYSFKINKITTMSDRNQFSDKNPAQVILIDYTYTNIASPDEVYLFDGYFKVIDSKGKIGYTYPNSITNYPQKTPTGATCDAQMIFGIDNASDKVKVNFYEDIFGDMTTSFEITVE